MSEGLSVAGFGGDRVWCWDDGVLLSVKGSGEVNEASGLPVSSGMITGHGDHIWLAAGADGLWRLDAEGWQQEQTEETTVVRSAYGALWIARAVSHVGEPAVLRSDDAGSSWWPEFEVPSAWGSPQTCQSTVAQQCADASLVLRDAVGLPVEGEGEVAPSALEASSVDEGCQGARPLGAPLLVMSALLLWLRMRWPLVRSP